MGNWKGASLYHLTRYTYNLSSSSSSIHRYVYRNGSWSNSKIGSGTT